jgi:hypothetical protein
MKINLVDLSLVDAKEMIKESADKISTIMRYLQAETLDVKLTGGRTLYIAVIKSDQNYSE